MVALRASVGFTEVIARGRKGWKGLEQHDHARSWSAAVMATRWSRLRGDLYLARKRGDGVVADGEKLTAGLWLGRIGQWSLVTVDFWLGGFGDPAELR